MEILLNLKEPLLSEGGGDPRSVEEKSSNDEEVMCTINNSQHQAIIDIESVDDPDVAIGHIGGDVLELGRAGSSRLPYCVSEWLNQHQQQISDIKLWAYLPSVLVFRIVLHLYDLTTDIALINEYWKNGDVWYFGLTVVFVLAPALLIFYINGKYYHEKWKVKCLIERDDKYKLKEKIIVDSNWKFILRFAFGLPLISPVVRYFDIFCYGWQQYTTTTDEKKRELYKKEKKREAERSTFFTLFESFLEAAPQLLLQMYILATKVSTASSNSPLPIDNELWLQISSVLISLGSLSLDLTTFLWKSWSESWVLFPAYFFTIGPRVTILAFFAASVNGGKVYIWFVLLVHCLVMAIFFRPQKDHQQNSDRSTRVSTKWTRKSLLAVSLVFTQIFTFILFKRDALTRKTYSQSFFAICGLENVTLLCCWCGMAGYTIGSLMLPIEFYVVLAFVALSLFVYCLCFYFSDELHRQYNQGAYFGSLKLSMAATHGVILKRAEMDHLLHTKEDLLTDNLKRLNELVQDPQVDINYRSEEDCSRTPLMLLCCSVKSQGDGRLLKCVEILLQRKDINSTLKDKEGSDTLTLLCRHYQGNDLNEVMRLLIRHDIRDSEEKHEYRLKDWSNALLNLCQFHEGNSLKEAIRLIIDCEARVLEAKNNDGESVLSLLFSRRSEQNHRIDLVKTVRFVMKRGLQWNRSKWINEIVNGKNKKDQRNALHVLCSVHNQKVVELVRLLRIPGNMKVNSVDGKGNNALHILLSSTDYNRIDNNSFMQLVEFFLNDCRIDPEAKNNENKDAFDILFDSCSHREDLIDLFRLLVGPSIYPDPHDDQRSKALLPLCTSTHRIRELYTRFAHRLIESGAIDVNAVSYITPSDNDIKSHLGRGSKSYHDTHNEGSTVLHLICMNYEDNNGDLIDLIRFLISETVGANANAVDSNKVTPLHILCQYYHGSNLKETVEFFVNKCIDVGCQQDKNGRTTLHCLCENQSENSFKDVFQLLIENSADVTKKTSYPSQNALHLLCEKYKGGDTLDVVNLLIEKGIPVDIVDDNKNNALHYLCENYHGPNLKEIVQLLLNKGVNVATEGSSKNTALHKFCKTCKGAENTLCEIIDIFIQRGINLTATNFYNRNVLHSLCDNYNVTGGILSAVKRLIEKGVDLNTTDNERESALHLVCVNYHGQDLKEIIELFIENNIDVNAINLYKRTALHLLCEFSRFKKNLTADSFLVLINSMTQEGLEIVNSPGDTALHSLCETYHSKDLFAILFALLIEKKVDVNVTDRHKRNALHVLCKNYTGDGQLLLKIVRLFIEAKIDLTAVDEDQSNALHLLCSNFKGENLLSIIRLFIVEGISVTNTNKNGRNALHCLCGNNYCCSDLKEIIQLLIENGIEVGTQDFHRYNALDVLCEFYEGDCTLLIEIFAIFIEKGINLSATDGNTRTVIHLLCIYYKGDDLLKIVRFLLNTNRIDVDVANYWGKNVLHLLVNRHDKNLTVDLVRLLIENMKNKETMKAVDHEGNNALHLLCSRRFEEEETTSVEDLLAIGSLLIDSGIDVNQLNKQKRNALHLLCQNYHHQHLFDFVHLLVLKGIDTKAFDTYDKDAIELLCEYKIHDKSSNQQLLPIVKLLVNETEKGIAIETEYFTDGRNPLYQMLENYEGADVLEVVNYYAIEKKIAIRRNQVLGDLRRRGDAKTKRKLKSFTQLCSL